METSAKCHVVGLHEVAEDKFIGIYKVYRKALQLETLIKVVMIREGD